MILKAKFDQPVIERVGRLFVLRDDLHPGGTKTRILDKILGSIPEQEIVYAGHPYGYAGIALANACKKHGKKATIFF